jgi:ketosteroid isomerase-like protein
VVSVAEDGESAWTAGELEYSVYSGDATLLVPFRITQLFGRKDGAWQVLVAVYSVPMPNDEAFAKALSGELAALAAIPEGIAAGADGIYTRAAHDLDRAADFIASVSDRADAIVIGTAPGERTVGGAAIKESYGKFVADGHVTLKKHGDLRVGIAPGGRVGWVLANADLSVDVDGNVITQPFRAMLVYVDEGGEWRLVQAHFSNGVS